jgi:DeoR family fructose operon transcriptional repressor
MLKKSRENIILDLITRNGAVEVKELMDQCNISENTVRRDLKSMEDKGLLSRTHGGAVPIQPQFNLVDFDKKLAQDQDKKKRLGKLAASFIRDKDVIFIDCGTTLYYMHQYLGERKNIIVITNSLPIVFQLSNNREIKTVMIGGEIDPERKASYGPIAEKNVSEYHVNKAFLGSDGVSLSGLSTYDTKESAITMKMAENADEVFLVVTSEKIEKEAFSKFATIEIIDHLFTDNDISPMLEKTYSDKIDLVTT